MGGANVLTGQSDQHWRAVRKGVSPAFSASRMRDACKVREQPGAPSINIIIVKQSIRDCLSMHVHFDEAPTTSPCTPCTEHAWLSHTVVGLLTIETHPPILQVLARRQACFVCRQVHSHANLLPVTTSCDPVQGIASSAEQLVQILHKQGGKACNVDVLLLRAGIDYVGMTFQTQAPCPGPFVPVCIVVILGNFGPASSVRWLQIYLVFVRAT